MDLMEGESAVGLSEDAGFRTSVRAAAAGVYSSRLEDVTVLSLTAERRLSAAHIRRLPDDAQRTLVVRIWYRITTHDTEEEDRYRATNERPDFWDRFRTNLKLFETTRQDGIGIQELFLTRANVLTPPRSTTSTSISSATRAPTTTTVPANTVRAQTTFAIVVAMTSSAATTTSSSRLGTTTTTTSADPWSPNLLLEDLSEVKAILTMTAGQTWSTDFLAGWATQAMLAVSTAVARHLGAPEAWRGQPLFKATVSSVDSSAGSAFVDISAIVPPVKNGIPILDLNSTAYPTLVQNWTNKLQVLGVSADFQELLFQELDALQLAVPPGFSTSGAGGAGDAGEDTVAANTVYQAVGILGFLLLCSGAFVVQQSGAVRQLRAQLKNAGLTAGLENSLNRSFSSKPVLGGNPKLVLPAGHHEGQSLRVPVSPITIVSRTVSEASVNSFDPNATPISGPTTGNSIQRGAHHGFDKRKAEKGLPPLPRMANHAVPRDDNRLRADLASGEASGRSGNGWHTPVDHPNCVPGNFASRPTTVSSLQRPAHHGSDKRKAETELRPPPTVANLAAPRDDNRPRADPPSGEAGGRSASGWHTPVDHPTCVPEYFASRPTTVGSLQRAAHHGFDKRKAEMELPPPPSVANLTVPRGDNTPRADTAGGEAGGRSGNGWQALEDLPNCVPEYFV